MMPMRKMLDRVGDPGPLAELLSPREKKKRSTSDGGSGEDDGNLDAISGGLESLAWHPRRSSKATLSRP